MHTGNDGTAVSLPAVTFGPVQLANRVPGSGTYPAYNHLRIADIVDETGGEIAVTYTNTTPTRRRLRPDARIARRYPRRPATTGSVTSSTGPVRARRTPTADWFEKYVISQVQQVDLVIPGTPAQVTAYTYNGTPGVAPGRLGDHEERAALVEPVPRVRLGDHADRHRAGPDHPADHARTCAAWTATTQSQTGGTQRSVTVPDSLGDPAVTDSNQYADMALETDTYSQAGGTVQEKSVHAAHGRRRPPRTPRRRSPACRPRWPTSSSTGTEHHARTCSTQRHVARRRRR